MKRFLSVLLFAILCFSLISCAEEPEPTTIDFDWGDDELETDELIGKKLKIWHEFRFADDTYVLGFRGDSPSGDALRTRIRSLEEKHQCEISLIVDLNYAAAIISGLHPCDLSYIELHDFREFASAGLVVPVDEYSDVIDVTDAFLWGFPNALETMMIKGTLYGVYPASWPDNVGGYAYMLLCNSGILYKNGYVHPQEYVENGDWTRDKLLEIAKNCYDQSAGIYGLETYHEWWSRMCLYSNNVQYIVKRSDGTYAYGMDSDAARDGLEFATRTKNELGRAYFQTNEHYNFEHGLAAFHLDWGMDALTKYPYISEIVDLSMLPFPTNPAFNPYGNWRGYLTVGTSSISLPICVDDIHSMALFMSELFAPIAGIETEEDLFDYYAGNVFFSENEFKNIWTAIKNSEYSYSQDGETFGIFNSIIASNMVRSPTESIEAHKDRAMAELERDVLPNKLAYEKYFGFDYFEQQ